MVNFIPAFICLAGVWIHQHQDKTFSSIVHRSIGSYTFRISFIGINILLVLLRLTVPADMRNPLYQAVYKAEPYLHHTIYYQDNNPFLLDGKEPFNFYKKYPQEMKLEKFQDSIPDSQLPCLVIWPVNQSRMLISNLYNKGYHADYLFTTFPQYLYQMIPATQRIDDQWALLAISRKQ
jgi:hypothetical protein